MQPVCLCAAFHDQQAAIFKHDVCAERLTLVLEAKLPRRAETQGSNDGVTRQRLLVIAVPGHALAAIMIEIEQAGIEGRASQVFHECLEFEQLRIPNERLPGGARVRVGVIRVAIPRDFARCDDVFSE